MASLKKHRRKILFFLCIVLIAGVFYFFWTYQPEFNSNDIVCVELVKVEDPNLGGVLQKKLLAPENIDVFYKDLRWSRRPSPGSVKMFTCYRIKVTTLSGKILSYRTTGTQFFAPNSDTLYNFSGSENRIIKYWNIQPDCNDLTSKF